MVTLFPKHEEYGLSSQMRRAAVSIPSNIAEGCARNGYKESLRFCYIALGSLSELDTQVYLAKELSYVDDTQEIDLKISAVRKLLSGFINYLQSNINRPDDL